MKAIHLTVYGNPAQNLKNVEVSEPKAPPGPHLVTPRRGFSHHGIHVARGNVVLREFRRRSTERDLTATLGPLGQAQ